MNRPHPSWIYPHWPAPANVRAWSTTRLGGVSVAPFDTLNLGDHVDDDPECVVRNRSLLKSALDLPAEPCWLNQVHGCRVVENGAEIQPQADGSWTREPGRVCAVMTADCLPVLLCDRAGTRVAALHAGWRGLAAGVLEAGVAAFDRPADELLAWLGPAIGPDAFEVGDEVRAAFVDRDLDAGAAFHAHGPGHWLADLYALARRRLRACGVREISGGEHCTFRDATLFFSYRRQPRTGRAATLIWLA